MSSAQQHIVNAHFNGSVVVSDEVGLIFENTDVIRFAVNRRSSFQHFKERVQMKLQAGSVSQMMYKNAVRFSDNHFKFVPLKIRDDEDVETMFSNHECCGFQYIDLYITFAQVQETQTSQVINPSIIPYEDVEDGDGEEENEAQVDDLYTTLFEEGIEVNIDDQCVPLQNVFIPPAHMTTLPLSVEGTSFDWPQNPRFPAEGDLEVGYQFKNKADCVAAIKQYHMKHCVDYKVIDSDKKRYIICCRNDSCKFRLVASYRKRSELWEIGIMNPPHSCSTTLFNQDHQKLTSQLMSQKLMPFVDRDPSIKVSVCISKIVSEFHFTPSYRKTWITRNKAIEQVYGNCLKVMKEETTKSSTHQVRIFDYRNNVFSVQETMDHGEGKPMGHYKVDLLNGWCDCGKFQAFRVPCSHVTDACSNVRHDAYTLLSDVYRVTNLFGVYSASFPVMPCDEYWPVYEGDQICHNPRMRRNKKGRPVSTRITTEMDNFDKLERKCSMCRQTGHNRTRCPNVGTSSR
ncbi:unnamed protein product [Lathyrus sativus]|nr:unnamed protein product [Lathyrus sativus]